MSIKNKTLNLTLTLVCSLAIATGCSSSTSNTDGGNDGTQSDSTTNKDITSNVDAPNSLNCDNGGCTDHVFMTIKVPNDENPYKYDFDGKGPKNRLGQILSIVNGLLQGASLQESIDLAFARGQAVILMRTEGDLTNDSTAGAQVWSGVQEACCSASITELADCLTEANQSCFKGDYPFTIAQDSPQDNLLGGSISSGSFSFGPADIFLKVPLLAGSTIRLSLSKARVSGKYASGKIEEGAVYGAIAQDKLESELLVDVKDLLNALIADSSVEQATKDALLQFFDKEEPTGEISVNEIKNTILGDLLNPDVDLDGDGTLDALSLGIGFTGVGATIQ